VLLNFWRKTPIEKRAYERIPKHLDMKVLNNGSLHYGLVTNLSENGMYFITGANLSSGLNIEVSIPFKEDNLKVPVKVIRIKKDNLYHGFGAEISIPYQDYIDFVHSLNVLL
jgi:hypothetical protein